jgi:hypothetical protein
VCAQKALTGLGCERTLLVVDHGARRSGAFRRPRRHAVAHAPKVRLVYHRVQDTIILSEQLVILTVHAGRGPCAGVKRAPLSHKRALQRQFVGKCAKGAHGAASASQNLRKPARTRHRFEQTFATLKRRVAVGTRQPVEKGAGDWLRIEADARNWAVAPSTRMSGRPISPLEGRFRRLRMAMGGVPSPRSSADV